MKKHISRHERRADKQRRRVIDKFYRENDTDRCGVCGWLFPLFSKISIGLDTEGKRLIVCPCCRDVLRTIEAVSLVAEVTHPVPIWQDEDRRWFEQNPDRRFRLRKTYRDEFPPRFFSLAPPGTLVQTLVRKVSADRRHRVPVTLPFGTPDDEASAAQLWAEFDYLTSRNPAAGDPCDQVRRLLMFEGPMQ